MALSQFFRFFAAAREHARLDADVVARAGLGGSAHVSYHRRVVWICAVIGALGATAGLAFTLLAPPASESDERLRYLAPLLGASAGIIFGVAVACLFAPRAFLLGPVGQRWMGFIGTKTTASVRFICAIVALLIGGVALFLALVPLLESRGILATPRQSIHR